MTADETLETGYGPAAPPGDNLVNDFQRETARSFAALSSARGDRVHRIEGLLTMADSASAIPFENRAVLEQPTDDFERVVHELRSFYAAGTGGPFLLDSAWPTPDLRAHGLELMGHPPLMVRQPNMPLPPAPAELRIVEVSDDETATDFERTLMEGFSVPATEPFAVQLFTAPARTAPGWKHLVGYAAERAVAVGSSYVDDRLLRVDNIATLADVRGRGYGSAITAATIAVDLTKPATLIASDLGRPIYEQLRFVAITRATYWVGVRS